MVDSNLPKSPEQQMAAYLSELTSARKKVDEKKLEIDAVIAESAKQPDQRDGKLTNDQMTAKLDEAKKELNKAIEDFNSKYRNLEEFAIDKDVDENETSHAAANTLRRETLKLAQTIRTSIDNAKMNMGVAVETSAYEKKLAAVTDPAARELIGILLKRVEVAEAGRASTSTVETTTAPQLSEKQKFRKEMQDKIDYINKFGRKNVPSVREWALSTVPIMLFDLSITDNWPRRKWAIEKINKYYDKLKGVDNNKAVMAVGEKLKTAGVGNLDAILAKTPKDVTGSEKDVLAAVLAFGQSLKTADFVLPFAVELDGDQKKIVEALDKEFPDKANIDPTLITLLKSKFDSLVKKAKEQGLDKPVFVKIEPNPEPQPVSQPEPQGSTDLGIPQPPIDLTI
jgi:hypothetical protein